VADVVRKKRRRFTRVLFMVLTLCRIAEKAIYGKFLMRMFLNWTFISGPS
jgi:hypothetical protein